ncbi:MAG: YidC/Oxa1 family membrane protein insertase [Clostridiales bacterium]|nr:YidC/Oxa1 family membrane protein insertase [Clostridiales bacterium]
MQIFDLIGIPLGYVLWFIYRFIPNYFVSIFLFTVLIRVLTFPFSLKSQKAQADRARLAPRLERLQKKYKQDPKKLQQKQMELYEKEGVSLTGGCLPMLIPMVVLFGVISVIYSPLTHLARIPSPVINATAQAVTMQKDADGNLIEAAGKVQPDQMTGYYKELRAMIVLEENEADIKAAIGSLSDTERQNLSADEYYDKMLDMKDNFRFFGGLTLLENPWGTGFGDIGLLWLIPLFSWLTALASSLVSMRYTKLASGTGEKQPGQGCTNVMMILLMPLFSLFITFTVPGGVGIYWIFSNLLAVVQTIVLNHIYNPVKIRAQAEIEYEERRRKKAEDKKRLAEARTREQEEAKRLAAEEAAAAEEARQKDTAPKAPAPSKNPNKKKRRAGEAADTESTDSPDRTDAGEDSSGPEGEPNADASDTEGDSSRQ